MLFRSDNNSDAGGAIDADFFWSFGDGGTSTAVNPEHSFAPGTYEVCLDIFTSDSCSDTYCTVIAVGGIIDSLDSLECNAYFTYDFLMGEVNFTNLSDDGGAAFSSYFWDLVMALHLPKKIQAPHSIRDGILYA